MTVPRPKIMIAATLAVLAGAPAAAATSPGNLFYERTLMSVAGARCNLFAPDVASALAVSAEQARGAALRSGADRASLKAVETRAQGKAAAVSCRSPDLAMAAERVRQGFKGYAKLNKMSFPGDLARWEADRGTLKAQGAWRLFQTARGPGGQATIGLASEGGPQALVAVAAWPGALAASSARIVVRDPAKSASPYIDLRRKDLASRTSPRSVSIAHMAGGRAAAPAALLPAGVPTGAAFRFSERTIKALEGLDPREALVLELVYPGLKGERVERIAFEVGDFAAGRAFLRAQQP